MKKGIAAVLMLACAPMAVADVVELSPDLYLAIQTSRGRGQDAVDIKLFTINEANKFAASHGKVAAPISGRLTYVGAFLKAYEYQFRLMSRSEALAAKPTLADAVVSVAGGGACAPQPGQAVAAAVPGLFSLQALSERGVLVTHEVEAEGESEAEAEAESAPETAPPATAQLSAQ